MKNKYFNEREKRLFNFFSNKDDYYKGCYFGETNPLIDNKINKIEKGYVSYFKKQLKKTKDKHEQEELLELIKLYEKPTDIVDRTVEELVAPAVIMEKIVKKEEPKAKDPIIFKTEPYRRDTSRLVYWCNPFEPINKGKLGSTQNWRINKLESSYY
jgi:hypothetical protein